MSHSTKTTTQRFSISPEHRVALDAWRFRRPRTEKEHTVFRERIQFQSADYHQFLADTARSSAKVLRPSPAWEDIPFPPVTIRTPVITEEPEGEHREMNASFDEIREIPIRRATPMDFGSQFLQRPVAAPLVPSFTFDRASFDDGLGGFQINHDTNNGNGAQPTNRETMITVGAVFQIGHPEIIQQQSIQNSKTPQEKDGKLQVTPIKNARASKKVTQDPHFILSDIEMAAMKDHEDTIAAQEQGREQKRNCFKISLAWVGRQLGKLF
ncbi:hypothetical protein NHQ30_005072 [Ciborinia camelliae]|nr:hypothetical protein NHQ30_005072 [Ciborinia camelliae]